MPLSERPSNQFMTLAEDDDEIIDLVQKLNNANLPESAVTSVKRDLNRLRKLPESSSDSAVLRIYIEYISDLPWQKEDNTATLGAAAVNIAAAKDQLDADHFG